MYVSASSLQSITLFLAFMSAFNRMSTKRALLVPFFNNLLKYVPPPLVDGSGGAKSQSKQVRWSALFYLMKTPTLQYNISLL